MNYKQIKALIKDMNEYNLDSILIETPDGEKVKITKNGFEENVASTTEKQDVRVDVSDNSINAKNNASEIIQQENQCNLVTSPIVGTFYASPAPGKEPFVSIGTKVKKGDTICIIEAMKLINEIECEYDGEIVEILVKNEEMVDFGKPLFKIA